MSLINDALKRAREAEQNRPPVPPHPPLAPTDSSRRRNPAARWLLLILLLGTLLLSAVSFWKWAHHEDGTSHARQASPPPDPPMVSLPGPLPSQPPSFHKVDASGPTADPGEAFPTQQTGASADVASSNTILAPDVGTESAELADASSPDELITVPPPPPILEREPELRLQSIIFRPRNPTVLINGQMLHKGDAIAGGTVTDIQLHAVTVQRGESNIVLKLPSY
jgi:hypothetical protein